MENHFENFTSVIMIDAAAVYCGYEDASKRSILFCFSDCIKCATTQASAMHN